MSKTSQEIYQALRGYLRENLDESLHLEFHDRLNPALWINHKLKPEVRGKLMKIAKDFRDFLGIRDLEILDITVSGSNAAYNYTADSDIDLHLIVNMDDLSSYARELFDAKKFQYNTQHDIKIRGYDVELYIQDVDQESFSLGVYSLLNDHWVRTPSSDVTAVDTVSAQAKFEKIRELINLALRHQDLSLAEKIKRSLKKYRQSGLRKSGEFGPENLAFKALRSEGHIERLYGFIQDEKNRELSLEVSKTLPEPGLDLIAEGAVPDNRIITKIREILAHPLRPSDLRAQMEAYFIVPDPSMLHDFRKIQAYEGDRADLRQTFKTYLATQIHPDILAKVGIQGVSTPGPAIEVQPQAEVRESITAGAMALGAPSTLGGMIRRPNPVKKRKRTKEHDMRLSEIETRRKPLEENQWVQRVTWTGPDQEATVKKGFPTESEAQEFSQKFEEAEVTKSSEGDYVVTAKTLVRAGDSLQLQNMTQGLGRTRSGSTNISTGGTGVRITDGARFSLPKTHDDDGNYVVNHKFYTTRTSDGM